MKTMIRYTFIFLVSTLFFGSVVSGTENSADKQPSAFLTEDRYDFLPVLDGVSVVHDFIIKNKGDAPLDITKVKTG